MKQQGIVGKAFLTLFLVCTVPFLTVRFLHLHDLGKDGEKVKICLYAVVVVVVEVPGRMYGEGGKSVYLGTAGTA